MTNNELEKKIGNVLITLGITPTLKGFYYILDAVTMFDVDERAMQLYEKVAIKNETETDNVVRNIKYSFSKMNREKRIEYFGAIKHCSDLISVIAWREL